MKLSDSIRQSDQWNDCGHDVSDWFDCAKDLEEENQKLKNIIIELCKDNRAVSLQVISKFSDDKAIEELINNL